MFKSTMNKGFQMTFENGWTVSVQFGPTNYCDRQDYNLPYNTGMSEDIWTAKTAEVAAWKVKGDYVTWYNFGHDKVKGHLSADEVAEFILIVQRFKK